MSIKLRTVTLQHTLDTLDEQVFAHFVEHLNVFVEGGYDPRTYRVVADPIAADRMVEASAEMDAYIASAMKHGFWAVGIPCDVSQGNATAAIAAAGRLLANDAVFINFLPAREGTINLKAVPQLAQCIIDAAHVDPMRNFRVGISSMRTKTPFFPFAHAATHNEFTVGLELVGLLTEVAVGLGRSDLEELRELLIETIIREVEVVQELCYAFEKETGITYGGVDLSLAPYPYPLEDQSVVSLIEAIGQVARSRGEALYEFGASGTHFINTYLTNILKHVVSQQHIVTTGFNGVMYSVLEDTYLSKRYEEETFTVDFLKLLSTTCGCGVDMVPLSGDVRNSTVTGIVLDVLSTGMALNKPLGVRVLPIPGVRLHERTQFRHLFFANTKIREIAEGATFPYLPHQQEFFTFKRTP